MQKAIVTVAVLAASVSYAEACGRRGRCGRGGCAPTVVVVCRPAMPYTMPYQMAPIQPAPIMMKPIKAPQKDREKDKDRDGAEVSALAEVNALRAARGLRPYVEDRALTAAARAAASYRASFLLEGHTQDDFAFLPSGAT